MAQAPILRPPIPSPRLDNSELETMLIEICEAVGLLCQMSTISNSNQARRIHTIKRRLEQIIAARKAGVK